MDTSGATAVLAATAATGLFAGAALYISVATVPHFSNPQHPVPHLLAEWRRFFPPAMGMQKKLAMLGIVASGLAAYTNRDSMVALPYVLAGTAQAAVVAFTYRSIMPLNRVLLPPGEVEKQGEAATRDLLVRWGEMHGVRTLLGGAAFGASLWGLHMLLTRK